MRVPLGGWSCVTGVSGSGKSTLVRDVLHDNLHVLLSRKRRGSRCAAARRSSGWESVERVLEVDQTPIGKTPRSCPATYVGFWDDDPQAFAGPARGAHARLRTASRFSFNVAGGRCEACEGQGLKTHRDELPAGREGALRGLRRRALRPGDARGRATRARASAMCCAMSVDDAVEFFARSRASTTRCALLQDVGLGYLTLGQPSPTCRGGEAQRIKLVTELARAATAGRRSGGTLYVLDEPTIGLHMADVEKLIRVLHRLVDAGHSVVVIEHNLDVIAEADWIIDLGPEGGDARRPRRRAGHAGDGARSAARTRRRRWRRSCGSAARHEPSRARVPRYRTARRPRYALVRACHCASISR